MNLETERLVLRPWREDDAEELYRYACDPDVGPNAGWAVHTDVENSREIIRNILSAEGTFAVVLKETGLPVGSIGIMTDKKAGFGEDEREIGYWLGKPYWGRGLIPEAVNECLRYCFEELGCSRVWCRYYDGNLKSKRVQEKCGFRYHHTETVDYLPVPGEKRTCRVSALLREDWEKRIK